MGLSYVIFLLYQMQENLAQSLSARRSASPIIAKRIRWSSLNRSAPRVIVKVRYSPNTSRQNSRRIFPRMDC
jgi:hypothetical protein